MGLTLRGGPSTSSSPRNVLPQTHAPAENPA